MSGRQGAHAHFGSSNIASTLCFRLRKSEKTPSSHFFIDLIDLPKASNRKAKARTFIQLRSNRERLTDISAGYVEEAIPKDTRDVFPIRKMKTCDVFQTLGQSA
jgi:hypothetical protein